MTKDSFVLKTDYDDRLNDLTDEEIGKLIRAIFKYEKFQEEPKLDRLLMNIFNFIKVDLDKNREKYEKKCKRNKEAVEKRWNEKDTNEYERIKKIQTYTNDTDNDNEYDSDYEYDISKKENIQKKKCVSKRKDSLQKKKYGNYKHVLLTDKEYKALQKDYTNYQELIDYLDEYMEMKTYKVKSHYLAIKRWVVDAVSEKNHRKTGKETIQRFENAHSEEATPEEMKEMDEFLKQFE